MWLLPWHEAEVMPQLERLKEQIAYLKFWQGVLVVTDISLIGWLVSNATRAAAETVALAIISVTFITAGVIVLHRQIERRIDQVGDL
ncbi:MAG: hypothetical protein NZ578_09765 [Candidatus Binatia bacterium]|nr:hypothetical protein [Candidatus Binatia bacterium]